MRLKDKILLIKPLRQIIQLLNNHHKKDSLKVPQLLKIKSSKSKILKILMIKISLARLLVKKTKEKLTIPILKKILMKMKNHQMIKIVHKWYLVKKLS